MGQDCDWSRVSSEAPRTVREQYMVMGIVGLGTKNHCAGEDHQQFNRQPRLTGRLTIGRNVTLILTWVTTWVRVHSCETRVQQMWRLLRKTNLSSRRRWDPISKHINGLGTKLGHGSQRSSKPRTTVLASAIRNLLDWNKLVSRRHELVRPCVRCGKAEGRQRREQKTLLGSVTRRRLVKTKKTVCVL
jgi:hypothetical protein